MPSITDIMIDKLTLLHQERLDKFYKERKDGVKKKSTQEGCKTMV